MNKIVFLLILIVSSLTAKAQTCSEFADYVKKKAYGSTYYSYNSDAISQVSFYKITDDNYNTYYFALVKFTSSYKEYLYQVGSNTKFNYSLYYMDSAGKAFWKYIQPYNEKLNCGPSFE